MKMIRRTLRVGLLPLLLAVGCKGCSSGTLVADKGGLPDRPGAAGEAGSDRTATDQPSLVPDRGPLPASCAFKIGTDQAVSAGDNQGFSIGGAARRFLVLKVQVPAGFQGKLPVVFTYHGTGGTSNSINGITLVAPQNKPFIKVAPQARVNTSFPVWDFQTRAEDSVDIRFFDEMLACLEQRQLIDLERVHAIGGSIGAIFVDYLLTHRGDKLASVAAMSGGFLPFSSSASYAYQWPVDSLLDGLKNRPAALVYWGGPGDQAGGFDFHAGALAAIQKLRSRGHGVVRCMHDNGHDWDIPFSKFAFQFFEAHPRGATPWPVLPKAPFPPPDDVWPTICSVAP